MCCLKRSTCHCKRARAVAHLMHQKSKPRELKSIPQIVMTQNKPGKCWPLAPCASPSCLGLGGFFAELGRSQWARLGPRPSARGAYSHALLHPPSSPEVGTKATLSPQLAKSGLWVSPTCPADGSALCPVAPGAWMYCQSHKYHTSGVSVTISLRFHTTC